MRILYLTQWFEPESNILKGVAFVRALENAGHEVTVVTGFPNYPSGRLYPGYRLRWRQHETIDGVRIVRLPLYPSHDASSLGRSLNYLSFFLAAFLYCLLRGRRFELAYVYHPPITVGLAAALGGGLWRLPFVLDVQDLWPDTIAASGMAGAGRLARPIGMLCRLVYRCAAQIVVQSEGMRRALIDRGLPEAKLSTVRNWANAEAQPPPQPESARCGEGPFTFVYGGNFGTAQGLETVIEAAAILARTRPDIAVRLIGDGIDAARLRQRAAGAANLRIEGPVPQTAITALFARADALLIHLRDDPLFAITIPSKTQAYLAVGRPIVAAIRGEAATLLAQSGAAIVLAPGDPVALARAFCELADLPQAQRQQMGEAGKRFYRNNLSFDRALTETLAAIDRATARLPNRLRARSA
jgi:glycosyltransferase involved in cell wall biosynthesis